MTYRRFVAASDDEIMNVLDGPEFRLTEPDYPYLHDIKCLHVDTDSGRAEITWSQLERYVKVDLFNLSGQLVLGATREGVTGLSAYRDLDNIPHIKARFETDELSGNIIVQLLPWISVHDAMLFQ